LTTLEMACLRLSRRVNKMKIQNKKHILLMEDIRSFK
jgi:hypothetical protein